MNKSKLLKMRKLTATPTMMAYAANDSVHTQGRYSWGDTYGYHVGRYLRCTVERDILKVAIFLTENMRAGGRMPSYEIYLDAKKGEFITYDCIHKKWRQAKADLLPWPSYVHYSHNDWESEKGYWLIKKHLNVSQGGYAGIMEFQLRVQADKLKQRHKRETDPWDLELAQTKPLPKDWDRWVDKVAILENYIFYQYDRKGAKTGYCSYCEREVPISKPRHNHTGECPRCHHKITFKSVGKAGNFFTASNDLYLLQRCDVGFMLRQFDASRGYFRDDYKKPSVYCREVRRVIYNREARPVSAYYWGAYRQQYTRWIAAGYRPANMYFRQRGKLYGKTLPDLCRAELQHTGLKDYLAKNPILDPEVYLAFVAKVPQLERMIKAHLPVLEKECFSDYGRYQQFFGDTSETSLTKAMGIDAMRMKQLRESGKGLNYLYWLRYEKQNGIILGENLISWLYNNNALPSHFDFLGGKMSIQQIYNYIYRQMEENTQTYRWVMETWKDTIAMAKRLQKNLDDPYVYRPSDLHGRHQEYVRQIDAVSDELFIEEQEAKYPKVNEICASIRDLYSYTGKKYMVVVPEGVKDIVLEGKDQSHCLGKGGRYFERIERRESYILFLRKRRKPKRAYYTLEVEPDGTIRQKRTAGDIQKPDLLPAVEFLREWQKKVAQRLTGNEYILAERSRALRQEEFAEMKKNNTIIFTGALRGQRLLDVLLDDLMVNEEVAAEAMPIAA